MKKLWIAAALFSMLLVSGCGNQGNPAFSEEPPEQKVTTGEESPELGETKVFQPLSNEGETLDLTMEISHVKEVKQGSIFDGMETWEYDIYVVYPGATVNVLNADTWIDEETNLPYADWAFWTSDDELIDIMDDLEPLELTEDILGVVDPESGLSVLEFELYSGD